MPLVPRPKVASRPVSAAMSRLTCVPPAISTFWSRMPRSLVSSASFFIIVRWTSLWLMTVEIRIASAPDSMAASTIFSTGTEVPR